MQIRLYCYSELTMNFRIRKNQVSIAGLSILDKLYAGIDFQSEIYCKFKSCANGDGGLKNGQLTFAQNLENFAGMSFESILNQISHGHKPSGQNLGGPAIVGAINAAQILYDQDISFRFFGCKGNDVGASWLDNILEKVPIDCTNYLSIDGNTPITYALSDPNANDGKGERTFICDMGVGEKPESGVLPAHFFEADVAWFGGTALVPPLHKKLTEYLQLSKIKGMFTIVNTIYDFLSDKQNPAKPWIIGTEPETYQYIDLLIMDWDEACRFSGKNNLQEIAAYFSTSGVSIYVITHGANNFHVWSDGRIFEKMPLTSLNVSELIGKEILKYPERIGDTTGCGDNFAGGFAASFIRQLSEDKSEKLSLMDAAAWAAASGGFACFTLGGTHIEKEPGEKYRILKRYYDAWLKQ